MNEQSAKANAAVKPFKLSQRTQIEDLYKRLPFGSEGERVYRTLGFSQNTGTARLFELKFSGVLLETGKEEPANYDGEPAMVLIHRDFVSESERKIRHSNYLNNMLDTLVNRQIITDKRITEIKTKLQELTA